MRKKILVTGINGFIGRALYDQLIKRDYHVQGTVRNQDNTVKSYIAVDNIGPTTNWCNILDEIHTVIHLAARVHVMRDQKSDNLEQYREVNTRGTEKLVRDSVKAGIKRFIYISTIKVNGEETYDAPFTEKDIPSPVDAYAISKWEAEQIIWRTSNETGLDVVVIRPPLVYGPGVKGNFYNMMSWLYRGIPLPFAAVNNKRSLVALDNLVDLIMTCIEHPAAANQTFLVSDDEDLSTTELLQRLAIALGLKARLFPVPATGLRTLAAILGKQDIAHRLLASLQLNISKTHTMLGWKPPCNVDNALEKTAHWYIQHRDKLMSLNR